MWAFSTVEQCGTSPHCYSLTETGVILLFRLKSEASDKFTGYDSERKAFESGEEGRQHSSEKMTSLYRETTEKKTVRERERKRKALQNLRSDVNTLYEQ
jgi:hypothetical protein